MGRQKKNADESGNIGTDTLDVLKDKYKNCFLSADFFLERKRPIISVSPTFDYMCGGIAGGTFVTLTSQPKKGKSTLCLQIAAEGQKLGFKTTYINIENRIESRDLLGINGLDLSPDKFNIIGSSKGNLLNAETFLDILVDLAETQENTIIVADSISQLCSATKFAKSVGERQRDEVPAMLSNMSKRIANVLPVNNNILICITHLGANQGNGPAEWIELSGQKVKYQSSLRLRITHTTEYKAKENIIGQIMHIKCETSNLTPPGRKQDCLLRYGYGIDKYYDLLSICKDIGLVTGSTWLMIGEEKLNGMENGVIYLKENPKAYETLLGQFKEAIQ